MLKRYLLPILTVVLLVLGTSQCSEKEEEEFTPIQSELIDPYYMENTGLASKRLEAIMYSNASSDKPNLETKKRSERFKLVHISDTHLSSWSGDNHYKDPTNLRQSIRFANQRRMKINAIVATGDYISNGKKEDAVSYMESFVTHFYKDNYLPSFMCTGNHDCNVIDKLPTNLIYQNELNALLFAANSYGRETEEPDVNYYYSDVPDPQGGYVRIIALDMLDQPSWIYNTMFYASYSQKQIDWLGNVALKKGMTPEHSVVILTHFPFQPYSYGGTGTYLCDGDYVHSWNMVPEIIEAYRSRASLNKTYPNKVNKDNPIQVDFNFSNTSGEFVCYLGGHAHCFSTFEIDNLDNRDYSILPQKMILCSNQAPSEAGTIYNRVPRKEKSESSNNFNIYAIDKSERNIYITFFGAYKPTNVADFPEIIVLPY